MALDRAVAQRRPRQTVARQVEQQHPVAVGQAVRHREPVRVRARETVHADQRRRLVARVPDDLEVVRRPAEVGPAAACRHGRSITHRGPARLPTPRTPRVRDAARPGGRRRRVASAAPSEQPIHPAPGAPMPLRTTRDATWLVAVAAACGAPTACCASRWPADSPRPPSCSGSTSDRRGAAAAPPGRAARVPGGDRRATGWPWSSSVPARPRWRRRCSPRRSAYGDPVTPLVLQKLQPIVASSPPRSLLGERLRPGYWVFAATRAAGAWLMAFPTRWRSRRAGWSPRCSRSEPPCCGRIGTVLGRLVSATVACPATSPCCGSRSGCPPPRRAAALRARRSRSTLARVPARRCSR